MVRLTKLTATVSPAPAAEACGSGVATTVASRAPRIQLFRDIDSSLRKRVERTILGKLSDPGPFSPETGRWRTAAGFSGQDAGCGDDLGAPEISARTASWPG